MVAPVVAAVAVAKLAYKPAMKLAKQLAKKYWSKGADKKQIVQEVRDKGVLEKFNSFKLKVKPKDAKLTKKTFKKTSEEREKYYDTGFARKAKEKGIDVSGKTKEETMTAVQSYNKANKPYSPRVKADNIKNLKKYYAKGGGIRKANYK